MKLKSYGIIIAGLPLLFGCQQSNEADTDATNGESQTQNEQMQAPNQQMPPQPAEVTDDDLQLFASIDNELQIINQDAREQMVGAIEGQGMDTDRFTEIQQSQQMPDQEPTATEEELAQYETAMSELQEIQSQAQMEMQNTIEDNGLTVERYQEIAMALQTNPELQAKLQEMQ